MNNAEFWASVNSIIGDGFTPEGLQKLDSYAEQFISGRLVYQRFSPREQHGCAEGGATHVIASLLAGAKAGTDSEHQAALGDFKRECQLGAQQEAVIEQWAKRVYSWYDNVDQFLEISFGYQLAEGGEAIVYDHGSTLIKSIGLDYFIQPIFALDRVSLHNAYFPETAMKVLGFGRTAEGDFKVIVEQPFIEGSHVSDEKIAEFAQKLGFSLINPKNWTYATPEIYLSDLHDENVIRSKEGNVFVVDCDIRINTPELKCGGKRKLNTDIEIINYL